MKMKTSLTIGFFFAMGLLHAQDFEQLIREMRQDYEQSKSLQIVMEISVYDSGQLSQPYYQQVVDIKRDGNNYWYQVEENEMLMNDKYLIMVDKQSRQISYSKRSVEAEAELQKGYQFNLDSVFMKYEKPQYLGKEDNADHYLVLDKEGSIKEIHFYIVPETRILKQVSYRYREGQYASIRFIVFDKKASFDPETFSEARYVTKVDKKMVPSRYFKQYSLRYQ